MSRPVLFFALAIVAAPAIAYLVFRLARELGFLEPPMNQEHELRRTITLALYTLLLFLSIFLFGWGRGWPRAWIIFAVINGLVLIAFAVVGVIAGTRLWKLRHPEPSTPLDGEREPAPAPPEQFQRDEGKSGDLSS
jgi:hypothetical protein